MATLRKRIGKWTVEIRRKGHRNVYGTFVHKSDARSFVHKVESEITQNNYKDIFEAATTTFKVALHRYIRGKIENKKDNYMVVTYDPKRKVYTNTSGSIKIEKVHDARAYNKLLNEPTATPTQVNAMAKRLENSRQYGGEKLFENIFDKNGLRVNSKKIITPKMKSNREVIKSIQPINVDEYIKIRTAEPVLSERIEPIRQEDPDMKQGIGALYKST